MTGVRFEARGHVQGVGFRPFVYRLATRFGLVGSVWNHASGVGIQLWGTPAALTSFEQAVVDELPPLARLETWQRLEGAEPGAVPPATFEIVPSRPGAQGGSRRVTPDSAPCVDCRREAGDPDDPRFGHVFINCTNCGPRYTLVRDLPYDRARTSMVAFAMCPRCAREYNDPGDRRFHAQPVCCPECGPRLRFRPGREASTRTDPGDLHDEPASSVRPAAEPPALPVRPAGDERALRAAVAALRAGEVVAVKGVGGYHLAVDARDAEAVERLRRRKGRDAKPLAVMVADAEAADALVDLTDAGRACLTSPAAPIVLAPFRAGGQEALAPAIAPGLGRLGVMLPSSPLHDVLVRACGGPLVMTSGNHSDEPLAWDDAEAVERLAGIADGFLVHDRPIVRAVDDSVLIDRREGPPLPLRRARGYVPDAFVLPRRPEGVGLCLGADLKSAVALVLEDGRTVLSEYLGDMSHPATYRRARATIGDLAKLFDVRPDWIAVDAHPGYVSHRLGRRIARELAGDEVGSLPVFEVQHHHAHLAALLAEHDRVDPIVGIAADGVGFGADGSAWGGEILVVGPDRARRIGRLRPLRLPGGDAAARETVRCGLSWLVDTVGIDTARGHPASPNLVPDQRRLAALLDVLERDLRCPPSSGLGRLFDAAAAVLGVCRQNRYEAESGQRLEALAGRAKSPLDGTEILPLDGGGTPFEIDHRPLLFALLQGVAEGYLVEDLAWFFHDAVADALARAGSRAARAEGLTTVGLSGGVFCNELLTHRVRSRLESQGVEVLTHRRVPPNDGGIALGQAAVVAAGGGSGLA